MQNKHCPCGSGKQYEQCCALLHKGEQQAETAEILMRSRYSAFVCHRYDYLLATWAKETRPDTLEQDGETVHWIGLKILTTEKGGTEDSKGNVTFLASYLRGMTLYTMEEKSSFYKQNRQWFYLDGKCNITTKTLSKNGPCPCGSEKKLKRCCLRT